VSSVTNTLTEFTEAYAQVADFVAVYIAEAHARNEWPAGSKLSTCDQPTTRQERLDAANALVESKEISMPLLVDDIDNQFDTAFSCWPVRFYVLHHGKVAFKAQPNAGSMNGYDFGEIQKFIQSYISK